MIPKTRLDPRLCELIKEFDKPLTQKEIDELADFSEEWERESNKYLDREFTI